MNVAWLLAGVMCCVMGIVHMMGGEYTLKHIKTDAFPNIPNGDSSIAKEEIRFGWHMVTVNLVFSGVVLLLLALTNTTEASLLVRFIAAGYGIYAILIFSLPLFALKQVHTLYRLPQWLLCVIVAGLLVIGLP